jgi:DNA-binding transcriptional LysR family regulator
VPGLFGLENVYSAIMKKFDDLLVYVRVVERGSFVGAARQLGLPPTTISRKVQELEERLGIQLLRRTTRKLSVTETGQAVYEAAARGFAAIDEAEALAIEHHQLPAGRLRVIVPHGFAQLRLEPLLPEFRALYPKVGLELLIANMPLDLLEYGCDLAIRIGRPDDSSYISRPLYRGRYRVVGSPAYLERFGRPKCPSDLPSHPIALRGAWRTNHTGGPDRASYKFQKGSKTQEITLEPNLVSSEATSLLTFALQDAGLAIVYELLCLSYIETKALEPILIDWDIDAELEMYLLYTRRATTDLKVKVFVDFLMKISRNMESHFDVSRD